MQKILVTEDDSGLNQAICYALTKNQYEPISVCSIEEAEEAYMRRVWRTM